MPRRTTVDAALLGSAAALLIQTGASEGALAQDRGRAPPAAALDTGAAAMTDAEGRRVGIVALHETPNGLLVWVTLQGIPEGPHGLHLHETGRCDAPAFTSAGGHMAPRGRQHGFLNERGPHAGDLPNVFAQSDGVVRADAFAPGLTLATLLESDGTAVVLHGGGDDYRTDPAGAAGDRLACGVVERASGEAEQ